MAEECRVVNYKSNEVLISGSRNFSINSKIYDSNGKRIGKIIRVLGNVDNPYALAILEKPSNEVSLKAVFL